MKRQLDWPALLLLIALLFGGLARFMPAFMTRFPINDGGMFYTMAQELSANGYALPVTTSYNGLDLPFAYPPLGLYLASLLSDASTSLSASLARIPLLEAFLWLPPLLSLLAIPAFYLLARALLADRLRAALAALFFALTPGRYDWHIMGGGVTRALGFLFLLLAAFYVLRFFSSPLLNGGFRKSYFGGRGDPEVELRDSQTFHSDWNFFFLAILFSSLAVLSHPEVGLQTFGVCAVLWLFFGRTRRGTLGAFLIAVGVFLLTAPWWGTVLAQHGFAPFLSALQTGQHAAIHWPTLLFGLFASGEFIPLLLILRLAGLVYAIWKQEYLFLALMIVPALLDPRSAASIAFLPLSMVAALGFMDFLPFVQKWRGVEMPSILSSRAGEIALLVLSLILFMECGLNNFRIINATLTDEERAAMNWLRENLPPDQNFLILTGRPYSMSDPVQEWFPVLAGQHSQTTLQGLEWILGAEFTNRLNDLAALQACADIACVEAWANRTGLGFDYLWVSKFPAGRPSESTRAVQRLLAELKASEPYRLVYENASAAIFER